MVSLITCMLGPKLWWINHAVAVDKGRAYQPHTIEKCGDQVLRSITWLWSLSLYTSPILIPVLHKRGYFTADGLTTGFKVVSAITLIYLSAMVLRGIGRWTNPEYATFLIALDAARTNLTVNSKKILLGYDFEFRSWPVEFRWNEVESDKVYSNVTFPRLSFTEKIKQFPCKLLGYIFAHTIGCRMVYPGSIGIIQSAMGSMLLQGRTKLIEEGGDRVKLMSRDGNDIDVMFVNKRGKPNSSNGDILVICTEGNAGFYEVGIMSTPLEAGYSVLGWNHPGFGGSTGTPFPHQEANAIDVIIQYSIHKLGFKPENIILFAWSIGGFSASWAAMNYPEIRGVILDATFDDLVPLATSKMPISLGPLVRCTIRNYMNLNNADQICKYPGPIRLIRRLNDEMITTDEPPTLSSNRANNLLTKLLQSRYPGLMEGSGADILKLWLYSDRDGQNRLWFQEGVNVEECQKELSKYETEYTHIFPSPLGEKLTPEMKTRLILFLARAYMTDYNSTHCTPLPKELFQMPWQV